MCVVVTIAKFLSDLSVLCPRFQNTTGKRQTYPETNLDLLFTPAQLLSEPAHSPLLLLRPLVVREGVDAHVGLRPLDRVIVAFSPTGEDFEP
jgi:hypothetical protein